MLNISMSHDIKIMQASSELTTQDILGSWKAPWGINRMNFKVDPGLCCLRKPDSTSPVLVTANYKISFDSLRKELSGLDAYILVLDTKGIIVWCADCLVCCRKGHLRDSEDYRPNFFLELNARGIMVSSPRPQQVQSGLVVI